MLVIGVSQNCNRPAWVTMRDGQMISYRCLRILEHSEELDNLRYIWHQLYDDIPQFTNVRIGFAGVPYITRDKVRSTRKESSLLTLLQFQCKYAAGIDSVVIPAEMIKNAEEIDDFKNESEIISKVPPVIIARFTNGGFNSENGLINLMSAYLLAKTL